VLAGLLLALAGCSDKDITVYRVPKDPAASPAPAFSASAETVGASAAPSANTNDLPPSSLLVAPTNAAGSPTLRWQAPPDWQAKPGTPMRKGSYTIHRGDEAADLSITAFPGDVGGLAANVNRWRGQVGLPAVDDDTWGSATETLDAHGLHFTLVDFAGPMPAGPQRILAAIASWQGATWFFKLTGPSTLVEGEKPAFVAFLQTVQPE
jgi:hypothetical protein